MQGSPEVSKPNLQKRIIIANIIIIKYNQNRLNGSVHFSGFLVAYTINTVEKTRNENYTESRKFVSEIRSLMQQSPLLK